MSASSRENEVAAEYTRVRPRLLRAAYGSASLVASLTVAGGRILRVDLLVAPPKLPRVRFTPA